MSLMGQQRQGWPLKIEDKITRTKLSKEAREKARHELKKLRQVSPMTE